MNSLDKLYKRQVLNEEYKIWKKNAPFMYDLVITHMLEWASLSVQWLPIFEVAEDPDLRIHNLVLGTDSPEGEKNYLLIVKVFLVLMDSLFLSLNLSLGQNSKGEHHGEFRLLRI